MIVARRVVSPRSVWAVVVCLTLLAIAWVAAAQIAHSSLSDPVPHAPAQDLVEVCRAFSEDSLFWGRAHLERRRRDLAADPQSVEGVKVRARLAGELLHHPGGAVEAVELFEEAFRRLPDDAPSGLRFDLQVARALAHLRQAEEDNCVRSHQAASCVVPFAPEAIHRKPDHTRQAVRLLLEALAERPTDVQVKWLLNLAVQVAGDPPTTIPEAYRLPPGAFSSRVSFPRFPNRAPKLGLDVVDLAGGAVMEDLDGDGWLDVVTSSMGPCDPLRAFRNDGHGGFEEVTRAWGLEDQLGGLNLNHADYDNDGHPDLLVLRGAWLADDGRIRNSLLRNRLHEQPGRFEDVTREAGLAEPAAPTQAAAWADYDGDGDLDLYVGNEVHGKSIWPSSLFRLPGSFDLAPLLDGDEWVDPLRFLAFMAGNPDTAFPSQLFRNNGNGTFTDVAEAAGVTNRRFAKAVTWGDYDGDGDPDLFVANGGANRLYRNEGDGSFLDVTAQAGVFEPSRLAFNSWFFDYDNDGDLDLFVADYSIPIPLVAASYFGPVMPPSHSVLYRNDGGRFTDVSAAVGLVRPVAPMGGNFGDLDNDGWPDLLLGTGSPALDALMPSLALRNVEGRSFEDVTFAAGFGHLQKGHGVAFGDVDNDGDQDVLEQMGGAFPSDAAANVLYENPGGENHWVTLRLRGTRANSFAVGARIAVETETAGGARRTVHALAGTGGSFGSSSLQQEIGLGDGRRIVRLTVRWPGSGTVQTFADLQVDRIYRLTEGEGMAETPAPMPSLSRLE